MYTSPLAYFISFRAYGTWFHGDGRGSVDRRNNQFGTPGLSVSQSRQHWEEQALKNPRVFLVTEHRRTIDASIREVCDHRGWRLLALNARTNHVHVVVAAAGPPEPIMTTFKAWATRRLREAKLVDPDTRVWSRHGSTIYLFKPEKLAEKLSYVMEGQ